jgi:phenylpyruvate tautomerase PptA (4-oxalocrotonate tautomerase family)
MDTIISSKDVGLPESIDGLNRRTVLMTAAVAAGAMVSGSAVLADTAPEASFGAPLVEFQVPAGVLTLEQKAAIIKGMTEVMVNVMKLPADAARKSFVQIFETAAGGFGVSGQVFAPRAK